VGAVMIKCPNTGKPIETGMVVDASIFRTSPVFFSQTFCPICRSAHQWFAKEAWVNDSAHAALSRKRAERRRLSTR
jgi:hypothetical protein